MGEIGTELARAAGVPSRDLDMNEVHERVQALRRHRRQRRTLGGACGVVLLVLVAALVIHVRNGGSDHLEVSGGSPDAYASGAWTKVAPSPLSPLGICRGVDRQGARPARRGQQLEVPTDRQLPERRRAGGPFATSPRTIPATTPGGLWRHFPAA